MLVILNLDMEKFFVVFKKAVNDWETVIKEIVKYTSVIKWKVALPSILWKNTKVIEAKK